jgi:hypothetical protein
VIQTCLRGYHCLHYKLALCESIATRVPTIVLKLYCNSHPAYRIPLDLGPIPQGTRLLLCADILAGHALSVIVTGVTTLLPIYLLTRICT